jgi:hypothetical protein
MPRANNVVLAHSCGDSHHEDCKLNLLTESAEHNRTSIVDITDPVETKHSAQIQHSSEDGEDEGGVFKLCWGCVQF